MILNRALISLGIGIDPSYLPSCVRALGEFSLLRARGRGDLRFGCGCGVAHTAERRSRGELMRSRGPVQAFPNHYSDDYCFALSIEFFTQCTYVDLLLMEPLFTPGPSAIQHAHGHHGGWNMQAL